jgi:hypothetical protein
MQAEVKTKVISRERLAYTAVLVSLSLVLGFIAPTVIPAVAAINSNSVQLTGLPSGGGFIAFWTNNASAILNPPPGAPSAYSIINETSVNGQFITYKCGPFGFETQPAGTSLPVPIGNRTLVVIQYANSPYCHQING